MAGGQSGPLRLLAEDAEVPLEVTGLLWWGTAGLGPDAAEALCERLESGSATLSRRILPQWPSVADVTVRLVVESPTGDHEGISLQFPSRDDANSPAMLPPGDANPVVLMIASPASWTSLLEGNANVMDEVLAGRLRCVNPNDSHRVRSDELHAVGTLLGLATVPVQPL